MLTQAITGSGYAYQVVSNKRATGTETKGFFDVVKNISETQEIKTDEKSFEISPNEAYEMMKATNPKQEVESEKVINGSTWNDEMLAKMLSGFGKKGDVDTTNKINWLSTGDKSLTDDQIADLKSRYNVSNLSLQEQYDLLSELTNMNVLSAEDVEGMFLTKVHIPKCGVLTKTDGAPSYNNSMGYLSGDFLSRFESSNEYFTWLDNYTKSLEFRKLNPNISKEDIEVMSKCYQDKMNFDNRMKNLFEQLR